MYFSKVESALTQIMYSLVVASESKQFNSSIGAKLRALRLERNLSQADFAKRLSVSPAYLNLIEKGRRTAQLPLLWKALETFELDVETFMASLGEKSVDDDLAKLLEEPLLRSLNLDEHDLHALNTEPKIMRTMTALFNLYKNTRSQLDQLIATMRRDEEAKRLKIPEFSDEIPVFEHTSFDEVIDFLQAHDNWFPTLEDEAERLRYDAGFKTGRIVSDDLIRALENQLGTRVVFETPHESSSIVRHYDVATQVLTLSTTLLEHRLKFQLAHHAGLRILEERKIDAMILQDFHPRHEETRTLIKIHLANYFAGAVLLPYLDVYKEVQRTRYDIELLATMYETSYETVAHRVCNLSDPRRRGIPMHFQRVDIAGNISKRYSATGLNIPHGSGGCPKWAVHFSFLNPSVLTKQYSQMPDGSVYFCFAKVMPNPVQGSLVRGTVYAIGLGTHAENAKHLVYADDMPFSSPHDLEKMSIPVGITCRFCERTDCNQRAASSYKFHSSVDEYTKKDNFFSPLTHSSRSNVKAI